MNRREFLLASTAATAAAAKTPERLKVTEARIYLIEVGGRRPVLAHILTDKGITGIGEAAVAYGTGATAAAGMIKDLAQEFLLGKDPFAAVAPVP